MRKEDSKKGRAKIGHSEDLPRFLATPEKKEEDAFKTVNLRDLSPFSPILRTIRRSFDAHHLTYDLAVIETPNVQRVRHCLIDEVDGMNQQISKVLDWEGDQDDISHEESSPFDKLSEIDSESHHYSDPNPEELQTVKQPAQQNLRATQAEAKAVDKGTDEKKMKEHKEKDRRRKMEPTPSTKKVTCNCKKTQCLKLYCDCFRENQVCGDSCNCTGCRNTEENQVQRNNAMLTLMERNPEAFKPKLEAEQHAKGCNCKRSACLKKYCECFQAGLACGEHCKCQDCKNCGQEQKKKKGTGQRDQVSNSRISLKKD